MSYGMIDELQELREALNQRTADLAVVKSMLELTEANNRRLDRDLSNLLDVCENLLRSRRLLAITALAAGLGNVILYALLVWS